MWSIKFFSRCEVFEMPPPLVMVFLKQSPEKRSHANFSVWVFLLDLIWVTSSSSSEHQWKLSLLLVFVSVWRQSKKFHGMILCAPEFSPVCPPNVKWFLERFIRVLGRMQQKKRSDLTVSNVVEDFLKPLETAEAEKGRRKREKKSNV